jgi:putative membrane protein insertion efficiency factor
MKKTLIALIDFYQQKISPKTRRKCRYYPTCSAYAKEALARYGTIRGGFLAFSRLLRCNPLFPGGVDKVPENYKIYMKAMFGRSR